MARAVALFFSLMFIVQSTHALNSKKTNFNRQDINQIIKLIKDNVDYEFSYTYVPVVIKSDDDTKNLAALGRFILVYDYTLKKLNRRELIATISHELAHTENAHLFKRMGKYIGLPVVHVFYSLIQKITGRSQNRSLKEHQEFLINMFMYMDTKMEMQADCLAYQWLEQLQRLGYDVSPQDLNKAMTKTMGIDFGKYENNEYFKDLPPYKRYMRVKSGKYTNISCARVRK